MNLQTVTEKARSYLPKDTTNLGLLVSLLLYFGIGFLSGLIIKFLGRIVLWLILISLISFLIFNYLGMITVNLEKIRNLIGISDLTLSEFFDLGWRWIQTHILETIAWLIGFILAFEIA